MLTLVRLLLPQSVSSHKSLTNDHNPPHVGNILQTRPRPSVRSLRTVWLTRVAVAPHCPMFGGAESREAELCVKW